MIFIYLHHEVVTGFFVVVVPVWAHHGVVVCGRRVVVTGRFVVVVGIVVVGTHQGDVVVN